MTHYFSINEALREHCANSDDALFHDPLLASSPGFATLAILIKQACIASFPWGIAHGFTKDAHRDKTA
ncbi:hypothetical protein [Caballeronia sp. DA-9]|uniref:hypothetical protein n=1 Tax=Caballeronia sp. DA-9 TaxID=3436237 RepID=UPI003F66CF79